MKGEPATALEDFVKGCEYIWQSSMQLTGKKVSLNLQFEVVGERVVDYAVKALEELICITEGKQHQIAIGYAQNVIQCESAYQTNKRKRKADDDFKIVITATEWHFLLYTSGGISCTIEMHSIFSRPWKKVRTSEDEKECEAGDGGLWRDRKPAMKKQRVQGFFESR